MQCGDSLGRYLIKLEQYNLDSCTRGPVNENFRVTRLSMFFSKMEVFILDHLNHMF